MNAGRAVTVDLVMRATSQTGTQSWWIFSIILSVVCLFMGSRLGFHPAVNEPRWGSLASGVGVVQLLNVLLALARTVAGTVARWSSRGTRAFARYVLWSIGVFGFALLICLLVAGMLEW